MEDNLSLKESLIYTLLVQELLFKKSKIITFEQINNYKKRFLIFK